MFIRNKQKAILGVKDGFWETDESFNQYIFCNNAAIAREYTRVSLHILGIKTLKEWENIYYLFYVGYCME